MKLTDKKVDKWVEPFVTIYGSNKVDDETLREQNPANYFVKLTQPDTFESYALALSSYWIFETDNVQEMKKSNILDTEPEFPENLYERISWEDFYRLKNIDFELNSAINDNVKWKRPFGKQMNNELYCGEGLMDEVHINSFVDIALSIYGDQEIELFYYFMSTKEYENDKLFVGKLTELKQINSNESKTPSIIYPKDKKWLINTDYDLPFSTIGGENILIEQLIDKNRKEIYKIDY